MCTRITHTWIYAQNGALLHGMQFPWIYLLRECSIHITQVLAVADINFKWRKPSYIYTQVNRAMVVWDDGLSAFQCQSIIWSYVYLLSFDNNFPK